MEGLLSYLDEQIDALRTHAAAALEVFDEKSVHQARVATRRLKAGLELLSPILDKGARPLDRTGRKLRRRLGPLRDLDVMIGLVAATKAADRVGPAVEWLVETLEKQRRDARQYDHDHGRKPGKLIEKFDAWWKLRHDLESVLDAIPPLLTEALHARFEGFAEQADWITGLATPPEDELPIDVHQVRIEGKALRYTLEMAEVGGVKLPRKLQKTFKAMQQSLGDWHDYVVMYERTLAMIVEEELALHSPELANSTLDLAKLFLRKSILSLDAFRAQWKKNGADLAAALKAGVPLITEPAREGASDGGDVSGGASEDTDDALVDVDVPEDQLEHEQPDEPDESDEGEPGETELSESETDPDPLATDPTEPPATDPPTDEPAKPV